MQLPPRNISKLYNIIFCILKYSTINPFISLNLKIKVKVMKHVFGTCPRDCYDTCSLIIFIEDNKVVKIEGRKDHPITQGFLCSKAKKYLEYLYNKDRVLHPMKRIGKKGEGKFKRISWDEALKEISNRMTDIIRKHGPQAILHYEYAGHCGLLNYYFPLRFFNVIGASGIKHTICDSAGEEAIALHYGLHYGSFPEDILKAKMIILWGINSAWTNLHGYMFTLKAKLNGAKVYVIDPVKTKTSEIGIHLRPRVGSDAALALGVANYIIENNLYDSEFIKSHTFGFERFKEHVKKFSLDKVSRITGLSREAIVNFAEEYASLKPNIIHIGYGIQRRLNGGEIVRAICLLPALIGLHRGYIYCNGVRDFDLDYLSGRFLRKTPERKINMVQLGKLLKNGEFKMIFVYGSNPLVTLPNQNLVKKVFQREDMFIVVHDIFKTETADYADILLPATTFFETFDIHVSYWHAYISVNEKAIEPMGEAKSNIELFKDLAKYMGLKEKELYENELEIVRNLLAKSKMVNFTLEELMSKGFAKLRTFPKDEYQTPSGKIEFYSQKAKQRGLNPLPEHVEIKGNYPICLLTPRHRDILGSQFRNVMPSFNPVIEINVEDAAERNISDGDKVIVYNDLGEVVLRAKISDRIPRGVALTYFFIKDMKGRCINTLTIDDTQIYGGCSTFNSTFVEIKKQS